MAQQHARLHELYERWMNNSATEPEKAEFSSLMQTVADPEHWTLPCGRYGSSNRTIGTLQPINACIWPMLFYKLTGLSTRKKWYNLCIAFISCAPPGSAMRRLLSYWWVLG